MKIYKKYKLLEPNRRKSVKREIKLMERMRNQHVARLYEVIDTTKYVILVMEYVGGGSLHGYLKSKKDRRLDEAEAKRIFKQVVEGLRYCHNRCITHRDIKLENLLLDSHKNIKIIDFGFSTCVPNDKKIKIFCGTPSYMGPEIVNKTEYCGPPADVWALGVLLFTCISGCFPYRGATDSQLYAKITAADYRLPTEVLNTLSPQAVDLIAKLFVTNADRRVGCKEILAHTWLDGVPLPPPIIIKNPVTAFAAKAAEAAEEKRAHSSQPTREKEEADHKEKTDREEKHTLTAP
jgi:serine/threonine protein kinase